MTPTYSTGNRLALRVPAANQQVSDFTPIVDALGTDVSNKTVGWITGVSGGMGAAGTAGRLFWATDTKTLSFDTGSAWVPVTLSNRGMSTITWPGSVPIAAGVTVNHGLPATPTSVQCTAALSAEHGIYSFPTVSNVGSTQFTVTAYSPEETPPTGETAAIFWLAIL
jgi:hypothetical protein